jgi:hypothetical protein
LAWRDLTAAAALVTLGLSGLPGCSNDDATPRAPTDPVAGGAMSAGAARVPSSAVAQDGAPPPTGIVHVSFGGEGLDLWPYTGASLDGAPSDPVNLLFVGKADPVRIRAGLLGLDGDRTAFGFPDAYPFNARWTDAIGDVQTTFAGDEGWLGSAIQLQCGVYDPLRVHLRLFRTGQSFGSGGTWTVGAAHFEVRIPDTADHQVLSWELAEQLVTVDLMRSGLLDAAVPVVPTGPITQVPSFREIIPPVYNALPEELKAAIGGPGGSVSAPVPIPNDGRAMMLQISGEAPPAPGPTSDQYTFTYNLVVPKPICNEGPLDFVLLSGPVELSRTTQVDETGNYQYSARVKGRLTVTPIDVTVSPPAPAGPSYSADVGDLQQGSVDAGGSTVLFETRRIAPQPGGTEMRLTRLRVGTRGSDSYSAQGKCP